MLLIHILKCRIDFFLREMNLNDFIGHEPESKTRQDESKNLIPDRNFVIFLIVLT